MNTRKYIATTWVQTDLELFSFCVRQIRGAVWIVLWTVVTVGLGAANKPVDLAAEISGAPVMYQQLVWVGATPPTDTENQFLYDQVNQIKKLGVAASIPALEIWVSSHSDSPWV